MCGPKPLDVASGWSTGPACLKYGHSAPPLQFTESQALHRTSDSPNRGLFVIGGVSTGCSRFWFLTGVVAGIFDADTVSSIRSAQACSQSLNTYSNTPRSGESTAGNFEKRGQCLCNELEFVRIFSISSKVTRLRSFNFAKTVCRIAGGPASKTLQSNNSGVSVGKL